MRRRVGVAGLGLIGGSIARRCARSGAEVLAWQPDEDALRAAIAAGMPVTASGSFGELAERSELLVLAAPVDATLELIGSLGGLPRTPALTIDVASVLEPPARAARGIAGFVATHPLAGSERSGSSAARPDLFEGRTWAYDGSAPGEPAREAAAFIAEMGARPLAIDPAEHDRIVALTSHLPQLLSVVLGARVAERIAEPGVAELCGTGLGSMLRLARSSWPMWRPIFEHNGPLLAQEVATLAAVLLGASAELDRGNVDALERVFSSAASAANRLPEDPGGASSRLTT